MPLPQVAVDVRLPVPDVLGGLVLPAHVVAECLVHVEGTRRLGARVRLGSIVMDICV